MSTNAYLATGSYGRWRTLAECHSLSVMTQELVCCIKSRIWNDALT